MQSKDKVNGLERKGDALQALSLFKSGLKFWTPFLGSCCGFIKMS